ncbi:MAG TPA: response regulator [Candidatus Cloacimonetes bacterium]|nr:response regulator [Candidatus Cloacimonadota bacterium]HEX37432.1 response regulator [Candidatus Cloacimonadota bacterium]
MDLSKINYYYNKFKFGEDNFHNLMKYHISEILLVSTFYDAFIFEQDGRLSEQIFGEYRQLNLSTAPRVTSVPTGRQALEMLENRSFDLVITMMRIGEISPFELSRRIKQKYPNMPVLLLLNVQSDISIVEKNEEEMQFIDKVFLWNGDTKLFLAMVKMVEDMHNVEYDTKQGYVRVILLIEDSIIYYSMFLPLLYSEILKQTQRLINEELSDINKRLQMRARPKVILVNSYEDAINFVQEYQEFLVAVISDVKFFHDGILDPKAGFKLIQQMKDHNMDVPVILQSSEIENVKKAHALGVSFLNKSSKTLLHDLQDIIKNNLGYGDFIFRDQNEIEIDRANTLFEFVDKIKTLPAESLRYHGERNHFSSWLVAHGEIQVAKQLRPAKIEDFTDLEELREYLLNLFKTVRQKRTRGKIINFVPHALSEVDQIIRLSEGSLGGKGRGLAFLNALLVTMEFEEEFPEVDIALPSTSIIGTSEYDSFIERNKIGEWIISKSDDEIQEIFEKGILSHDLIEKLRILIQEITYPIAVRSSGLLEDSQSQPFAGIYKTFLLPNNHPDEKVRLKQLCQAIKLVFSSVYMESARSYIESINYKVEEEKMAVIIQEIVGSKFDGFYYPHFSGVGQSYNFYPISYLKSTDGVVSLAVGLGKAVVEGERNFRFCPKYPKMEIIPPEELVRDSQKFLYAVDLNKHDFNLLDGDEITLSYLKIHEAEKHGTLQHMTSMWDYENSRFIDGVTTKGLKVVTFADILKYNYFPLAKISEEILDIGEKAMGVPVEIEFAVNLNRNEKEKIFPTFYVLQIRPLTINTEEIFIDPDNLNPDDLMLYTENGMGNGLIDSIYDVVFVDLKKWNKTKTEFMRDEISRINMRMKAEDRNYILIGPGRWGSRDKFLGIPVKWPDINMAKIIIEMGLEDFVVDSSQGTHFFHNLVSMDVGYFSIPYVSDTDFIDWEWLENQRIIEKTDFFIHVQVDHPLVVKMDGRKGLAVIYK